MEPLYLRSASTSLVISFDSGEAEVIHWGADLGPFELCRLHGVWQAQSQPRDERDDPQAV